MKLSCVCVVSFYVYVNFVCVLYDVFVYMYVLCEAFVCMCDV